MAAPDPAFSAPQRLEVSWLELGFILLVLLAGFHFLGDAVYWGRNAYIGNAQFGDAEFWWNGALQLSQGIIAENPNFVFRMGYATFAGFFVAVCGPNYHLFHKILITLFLVTVSGLYLSLRPLMGRLAACAIIIFFVFNAYTAKWLAISTSDSLGLILNLAAIIALIAGISDGLRLSWIAVFGVFLVAASLTRPLMTPYLLPGILAVVVTGWSDWRRTAQALAVLLASFFLPTLIWMGVMGVTTGNFALTGANQDSSIFYAASDPHIQSWRGDMYVAVNEKAIDRFRTQVPTPRQLNAEFWTITHDNYLKHWRYHADRLAPNVMKFSEFTPDIDAMKSPKREQWRQRLKWILTLALVVTAYRQQRQWSAIAILVLGSYWVLEPAATPWLVLGGASAGLIALLFRRVGLFLWAVYWWIGVAAMYLVGGTIGPPLVPIHEITALGFRLGFQFLFANDIMIIGLLGCIALNRTLTGASDDNFGRIFCPSPTAERLLRICAAVFFVLLLSVLLGGALVVTWRVYARSHTTPIPYPNPTTPSQTHIANEEAVIEDFRQLSLAVGAQDGRAIMIKGQTGGFVWNMPGQERSMLQLYQQDNIRPISLGTRMLYVEVAGHLSETEWINRRGAWTLRSYRDFEPISGQPYYFQRPAIRSFVPLSTDGKSYDVDHAVIFPVAKAATQLVAGGALNFTGAVPEWSMNSGSLKFPRRFALRAGPTGAKVGWNLDLTRTRGARTFGFSVQREAAADSSSRLRLVTNAGVILWEGKVTAGTMPTLVQPVLPAGATSLRFTSEDLRPGDTLWFYELVLRADDFAQ